MSEKVDSYTMNSLSLFKSPLAEGITTALLIIDKGIAYKIAGLFGILVPVTLKKMNIDPAIASSVFVTTITDVIGFVSFLGVGAYFL